MFSIYTPLSYYMMLNAPLALRDAVRMLMIVGRFGVAL